MSNSVLLGELIEVFVGDIRDVHGLDEHQESCLAGINMLLGRECRVGKSSLKGRLIISLGQKDQVVDDGFKGLLLSWLNEKFHGVIEFNSLIEDKVKISGFVSYYFAAESVCDAVTLKKIINKHLEHNLFEGKRLSLSEIRTDSNPMRR